MTYLEPARVAERLKVSHPPRPARFQVEDFDTLKPGSLLWRVKGLWPAVGVCFVGGPSMCGKSFWVLDASARVVRGEDVLGRKAVAAGALYIASEGAHGVKNRIAGLRSRVGSLNGGFRFIGQAPNLTDPEDVDALRSAILGAAEDMHAAGHPLGLVVVDTLSASVPGADENSAKDMSPVLAALQTLAADLGAVVLVVAHTGKDESRGLRGWSGLLGNADGLIMLEDPAGQPIRTGSVVKVKDGVSGDAFAFSLEVVTIGEDDDGDEITTCVVRREDPPARPKRGRRSTVAETDGATVAQAFNRLFPDKSSPVSAPGAENAFGLTIEDLRTEAFAMGLGPTAPDLSGLDEPERNRTRKAWRDHRNKAFDRALKALQGAGKFRVEKGRVWEPTQARRASNA